MIADLQGQGEIEAEADFAVIGAGTVGLLVAVLLARKSGRRVVCLESGGEHQLQETHPLNEVVHSATEYKGAAAGRFRCLGGTSTRWGGALIPLQDADVGNAGWPVSMDELRPYIAEVEALFRLGEGPYLDPRFPVELGEQHVHRLAKWPAFSRRNVFNLVGDEARSLPGLQVWMNATATGIEADEAGVRIEAASGGGDRITLRARHLIVAAGAIETTRLALLMNAWSGGAIEAASPSLGRYFSDHVSVGVAELEVRRPEALNKVVGFRFDTQGQMRNIRFELAGDSPARAGIPPSFVHVGFETSRAGGFDVLREVFRHVQMRRLPPPALGLSLLRHLPWLSRAVWWRYVHKRLLFPAHSRLFAHLVIEQMPHEGNRISLSRERADALGVPLADIHWKVEAEDFENIRRSAALIEATWKGSQLAQLATWKGFSQAELARGTSASIATYHPTGSTRMGHTAAQGVVDRDLRLFAFPRVQLLSTSVLPTGGGANPTMTLLLLALRCVEQHMAAARP